MIFRKTYIEEVCRRLQSAGLQISRAVMDGADIDDDDVIKVHRGKDIVLSEATGWQTRQLHFCASVATSKALPEDIADGLYAIFHPLILLTEDIQGVVSVEEVGIDEPIYGGASGRACLITHRYAVTYQVK